MMVIPDTKTHTEAYWDMINKSHGIAPIQEATAETSIQAISTATKSFTQSDFHPTTTVIDKFTAWLRKHAD